MMPLPLTFEQARDFEKRLKTRLEHEAGWRDFFTVPTATDLGRGDRVQFLETGKWLLHTEKGVSFEAMEQPLSVADVDIVQDDVLLAVRVPRIGWLHIPYSRWKEYVEKVPNLNALAFEVEDPWVGWLVVSVEGTPDADPEANRYDVTSGGRYGGVVYVEPLVGDIVKLYAWYANSELDAVNQYDRIKVSPKLQAAKTTWVSSSDVKKLRRIG